MQKRISNWESKGRQTDKHKKDELTFAEKVRLVHGTVRELVQLAFYLLITSTSFVLLVIGLIRLRLLVG